jgi:hypothetical protein
MESLYKLLIMFFVILCIGLSYMIVIPAIPSEADCQGREAFLTPATLISLGMIYIAAFLLKKKFEIFKSGRLTKRKLLLLIFSISFTIHLLLRLLLWQFAYLSEYGYFAYNVLVHSLIYSFLMSGVFYLGISPGKSRQPSDRNP